MEINISCIGFDHDELLNEALVSTFCDEIQRGTPLPAPILMRSGKSYAIVDGRHRIRAAQRSGATRLEAHVIEVLCPQSVRDLRRWLNDR
jgi:hypothetical protein